MLLPLEEVLCAFKFDEMSIRAAEEYSKKYDVIKRLVDMGKDRRDCKVAKHALLFCIHSIDANNRSRAPIHIILTLARAQYNSNSKS